MVKSKLPFYQARDEVIALLKSEKTDPGRLRGHYGLGGKEMVLRALQRDSLLAQRDHSQDGDEKSMAQVSKVSSENPDTTWGE